MGGRFAPINYTLRHCSERQHATQPYHQNSLNQYGTSTSSSLGIA